VALALPLDVQKIADSGLLRPDWRKCYPNDSVGEKRYMTVHLYTTVVWWDLSDTHEVPVCWCLFVLASSTAAGRLYM
jgi:hypothetical protein